MPHRPRIALAFPRVSNSRDVPPRQPGVPGFRIPEFKRPSKGRIIVSVVIAAVLLCFWATAWPVSTLRGTVFPSWSSELTRITDECAVDPNRQVVLQFSPGWPPTDLVLPEPTNAVVRCVDLRLTG